MKHFFLFLLSAFLLVSCDRFRIKPEDMAALPPDPEELRKIERFKTDSATCLRYWEQFAATRKILPENPSGSEKCKGAYFSMPSSNDNFPLFTYSYFMYPDSATMRNWADMTSIPSVYKLSRAELDHPSYTRRELDKIFETGYIFILYPKKIVPPVSKNDNEFTPGTVKGTVLVVNTISQDIICRIPIDATNGNFVSSMVYNGHYSGGINEDLQNAVIDQIRKAGK